MPRASNALIMDFDVQQIYIISFQPCTRILECSFSVRWSVHPVRRIYPAESLTAHPGQEPEWDTELDRQHYFISHHILCAKKFLLASHPN